MQDDAYRDLFLAESEEYLKNIGQCLVKLEEDPAHMESLNEIFRCLHTLKGMSATMGFDKLSQLSHAMENLLDELRSQRITTSSEVDDVLFSCLDVLETLVEDIRLKQASDIDINPFLNELRQLLIGQNKKEEYADIDLDTVEFTESERNILKQNFSKGIGSLKIKITLSDECILKQVRAFMVLMNLEKVGQVVKSLPSAKVLEEAGFDTSFIVVVATKESPENIRPKLLNILEIKDVEIKSVEVSPDEQVRTDKIPAAVNMKKIQSMRIPVERLDKIMNLVGELAIAKMRLMDISQSYKIGAIESVAFSIDRLIATLQDEVIQTRLIPIAYILDTFPRMVRDLAKKSEKEVDFQVTGSEIELDRVILDEISDPFIHLLRNAVDHGIETVEERLRLKKDPRGKVAVKVTRDKGQIFIDVSDDGKGVDYEAVKRVAKARGLVSVEEIAGLDEKGILGLLTMPGFSTNDKVTEVSGRGVGLDVVKTKIESLGGRLDFTSKPNEGSRFVLTLPLTVAIIKAMLITVREEIYAIPLMNIRETIKIEQSQIKLIKNFEVIKIRDEVIPVVRLDTVLSLEPSALREGKVSMVIVELGTKGIALIVSEVLGEQDIVVKPLGALVKKTRGITGATILGNGKVALILDVANLK
jgi:two-component system chemotaxis sensor kinase CheA